MNYQNNKTETSVIQLALKRAGVLDGEIDGIFGSDTRNAVISFQKAASLSPDGIVGPKTYAALLPYLKGYTIHRVKKGDSLYSIAAMHNTSTVSYTHLTLPTTSRRQRQMCIRDRYKHKKNYACKSDG